MGEVYTWTWAEHEQYTFSWHPDTLTPWHWLFNNTDNNGIEAIDLKTGSEIWIADTNFANDYQNRWAQVCIGIQYSVFSGPSAARAAGKLLCCVSALDVSLMRNEAQAAGPGPA